MNIPESRAMVSQKGEFQTQFVSTGGSLQSLVAELKQCGNRKDLELGKLLHSSAVESGCHTNIYVATTLISMYSKCRRMKDARHVFDNMIKPNVVSWNALILGYVDNGQCSEALDVFHNLNCTPDHVTFVAALKACTGLAATSAKKLEKLEIYRRKGLIIHRQASELGVDKEVAVANTLVSMYSKFREMALARHVFDGMMQRTVVSWTALISGYVDNGDFLVALELFNSMDCPPNCVTIVAALKACVCLASGGKFEKGVCRQKGFHVHVQAMKFGFADDIFVASTLVDMYSKCRDMATARDVFDKMIHRDVVSWNTLILGYVENGMSSIALDMFDSMDCVPNRVTFVAALKACAGLGAFDVGQRIHVQVRESGLECDEMVATSLVDFYGKCGDMIAAEDVFEGIRNRDVVSWNALIGGYSSLGDPFQTFRVVKRMKESGQQMNHVTMLFVLTACSRTGRVEEGQRYFDSMAKHGISPTMEHYSCMVDMLGRVNRLEEAFSLVKGMPFAANSVVWNTLLGACAKWHNLTIAEAAFRELVTLNEDRRSVAAAYVLMGNIYENLGIPQDGARTPECN